MILKTKKRDSKTRNMLSELEGKHLATNWEKLVRIQSRASTYLIGGYDED